MRDPEEPIAHIVQAVDATLTAANAAHLYEDVINIIDSVLARALETTRSPSERWRFNHIRKAMAEDIEILTKCGLH